MVGNVERCDPPANEFQNPKRRSVMCSCLSFYVHGIEEELDPHQSETNTPWNSQKLSESQAKYSCLGAEIYLNMG